MPPTGSAGPWGNCISSTNRRGYVLDKVQRGITSEIQVIVWDTCERRVRISRVLPEGMGSVLSLFA
jgi:hypothetical protein